MEVYQLKGGGLLVCPYCNSPAEFHEDSIFIYGKDYGAVYACCKYPACDSYIGVHKGTQIPLGRLANKELRQARIKAHQIIDKYWQDNKMSRNAVYKILSKMFGKKEVHIGELKLPSCKKIIEQFDNYIKPNKEGE